MPKAIEMAKPRRQINVNVTRRQEIGAERRRRTQAAILDAAFRLYSHEHGRLTRTEDICQEAEIARGTLYNYFADMEALGAALAVEISRGYDAAIHDVFETLATSAERTAAAIRFYLRGALLDREWGWAMVNTSIGKTIFSADVAERAYKTIGEGMANGEFQLESADAGRDVLLGTSLAATMSLIRRPMPPDYPETIATMILNALGVVPEQVRAVIIRPLPELPLPTSLFLNR